MCDAPRVTHPAAAASALVLDGRDHLLLTPVHSSRRVHVRVAERRLTVAHTAAAGSKWGEGRRGGGGEEGVSRVVYRANGGEGHDGRVGVGGGSGRAVCAAREKGAREGHKWVEQGAVMLSKHSQHHRNQAGAEM
jgi:hypothetical protein